MSFLILSHVICHGAVVSCQNFFFPPTMEDEAIYAAMAVSRNVHARNERTWRNSFPRSKIIPASKNVVPFVDSAVMADCLGLYAA